MNDLESKIKKATELKPKFGEPCNYCGWCCLTEVCPSGEYVLGTTVIPCDLLKEKEKNKWYCSLALGVYRKAVGIDKGCCAQTQDERIKLFREKNV